MSIRPRESHGRWPNRPLRLTDRGSSPGSHTDGDRWIARSLRAAAYLQRRHMDANASRILKGPVRLAAGGDEIVDLITAVASGRDTRSEAVGLA